MFETQKNMNTLDIYCEKNKISTEIILQILSNFTEMESLTDKHNDSFIEEKLKSEKDYLDKILFDVDKNIFLDENQRKVVLTDEDHVLVIAGAGAGKSTTVAAKVKYLVEKKNIDPKEILIISFTNKAVEELQDKINKDLKIDCPITTFHATGNAILRKVSEEKPTIAREGKLYYTLQDYFRESILKNEQLITKIVLFFANYFDFPYSGEKLDEYFAYLANSNFSTMKSELNEYTEEAIARNTGKKTTIQQERCASQEEVEIANFLYMNGIEYVYEPIYPYLFPNSHRPYTPDFAIKQDERIVYIEHFGLNEKGENSRFSSEDIEKYKQQVHQKVEFHKQHDTELIFTFSGYNDGRPHIEHLQEALVRHNIKLNPRDPKEVMQKIIATEGNKYIRKMIALITRFIENFKTNGFTEEKFTEFKSNTKNPRTQLFMDICHQCYLEYERSLRESNTIDFSDMINLPAMKLAERTGIKDLPDFKYIIIDEYQDISRQRFNLAHQLSLFTKAKIMAVGDDWQSIYAFSGADITLFTKFAESVGYAKQLTIDYTYRNSQEVIDIAGDFIQKNQTQIQKQLHSPKHIKDPVIIYTYDPKKNDEDNDFRNGEINAIAHAVETAIEKIIEYTTAEGKNVEASSILLLGRFGFDGQKLGQTALFNYKDRGENNIVWHKNPKLKIAFMTAHASKGLGRDNVIVINGKNGAYGFPSKIENDPVIKYVTHHDDAIEYAEERRLFYVAMTRTKNRVFFIAPEENPSEFLLELKKNYKNIKLEGEWNDELKDTSTFKKKCPICGYPLTFKFHPSYGLSLYICTNDPEICDFMTNKIEGEKLQIIKCPDCVDGYLVVRKMKNIESNFLGCTNFKKDKSGCNKVIFKNEFYHMMGYDFKWEELKKNVVADVEENPFVKEEKLFEGRCIRCGGKIKKDTKRPYCSECYTTWAMFGNVHYQEPICHFCGKHIKTKVTMAHPLCDECENKNKKN